MAVIVPIDAIVLAGGPRDAVAALSPDAPNKAFVSIGGTTLVARTIASLRGSRNVGRIVAVAPRASRSSPALAGADDVRDDGATISGSLRAGLAGAPPDALVLVCASDLPVLSVAAIDEFVALARASDADIVYACVERATHLARYAHVPHTWARLRDGTFCGGGCAALRPRAFDALDVFLGRLGAARKNPLRLASIFGAGVLARYALGRLTVDEAERSGSALVGVRVAAAICTHPDIAINVDRPSDVELAERLVRA